LFQPWHQPRVTEELSLDTSSSNYHHQRGATRASSLLSLSSALLGGQKKISKNSLSQSFSSTQNFALSELQHEAPNQLLSHAVLNGSKAHARTTGLYRAQRGRLDPRTGIILLQCGDTVSHGAWGSTDAALITRFHGHFGQRYTVSVSVILCLANRDMCDCSIAISLFLCLCLCPCSLSLCLIFFLSLSLSLTHTHPPLPPLLSQQVECPTRCASALPSVYGCDKV
jgi:hypothetical protein